MLNVIKIVAIATAIGFLSRCTKEPTNESTAVNNLPTKVENQEIEAFGIVKAKESKVIAIDFPAWVEKILVKEGQNVIKGTPLINLNIDDFDTQIRAKEHELRAAIFDLRKSKKNLREAKEDYDRAQKELAIKENLMKEGIIPRKEVEEYREIFKGKVKAITDLQLSLNGREGQSAIHIKKQKIAILELELERMRSKLDQSFVHKNVIISPINGVISEISYSEGEMVNSEKGLLTIINRDNLVIDASVSEEFIRDVKIGAPASILPVADSTRKYKGEVSAIAGMATKQGGETSIAIEIRILNPDEFLKPFFNVDTQITKR